MDPRRFLSLRVSLLLLFMPRGFPCMSVRILNEEPVHQIPGSSLVLQAQIEHGPLEAVSMVTWEREAETGIAPGKVTLATCPGKSLNCTNTRPNVRVSVDQRGTTLKMNGYGRGDSGVYVVSVADQTGTKTTAHCIVREYEAVHHVSVSINVSHSTLVCGEAWGTDPRFSWLHERASIAEAVGSVSSDGRMLFVSLTPMCGDFTCRVSNRLGYSSATYTAAPCEVEGTGTTAALACLAVLLLVGVALVSMLLWRRHRYRNRGQRLREHLNDNI